jgi:hypothetical protein
MARPVDRCPRCNSPEVSAERQRSLGGELKQCYVRCPKCHLEIKVRKTTDAIEAVRRDLRRWQSRNDRAGGRVSSEQVRFHLSRLRNAAARDGLADQVPELCQPNS